MPDRIANSTFVAKGMLSHEWAMRRMDVIDRRVKKNHGSMEPRVYGVPEKIDTDVTGTPLMQWA